MNDGCSRARRWANFVIVADVDSGDRGDFFRRILVHDSLPQQIGADRGLVQVFVVLKAVAPDHVH